MTFFDTKYLPIALAIGLSVAAVLLMENIVFGNVFIAEDDIMLCLSNIGNNITGDVTCKVYHIHELHDFDIHQLVSDMIQERDTFSLEVK
jgi:hypothetical protein